jgi:hypothetical protein
LGDDADAAGAVGVEVDGEDGVGVLADGAGFAEFAFVVDLGEAEDDAVQFAGEAFAGAGDLRDDFLARFAFAARAEFDELEVVEDEEVEREFNPSAP